MCVAAMEQGSSCDQRDPEQRTVPPPPIFRAQVQSAPRRPWSAVCLVHRVAHPGGYPVARLSKNAVKDYLGNLAHPTPA